MTKTNLITLLSGGIVGDNLKVDGVAPKFLVELWEPPLALFKKYLLNGACEVLFTVKRDRIACRRVLQRVPHTLEGFYLVDVWVLDKLNTSPARCDALREAAVLEVQRVFNVNPQTATLVECRDDDHTVNAAKIYNTAFVVQQRVYQ